MNSYFIKIYLITLIHGLAYMESWKIFIQTLGYAHLHSSPLKNLTFTQQPTVRDVLNSVGQPSSGIKVFNWGTDYMTLDQKVEDGAVITITNDLAERRKAAKEAADKKLWIAMDSAQKMNKTSFDEKFVELVDRNKNLEP